MPRRTECALQASLLPLNSTYMPELRTKEVDPQVQCPGIAPKPGNLLVTYHEIAVLHGQFLNVVHRNPASVLCAIEVKFLGGRCTTHLTLPCTASGITSSVSRWICWERRAEVVHLHLRPFTSVANHHPSRRKPTTLRHLSPQRADPPRRSREAVGGTQPVVQRGGVSERWWVLVLWRPSHCRVGSFSGNGTMVSCV